MLLGGDDAGVDNNVDTGCIIYVGSVCRGSDNGSGGGGFLALVS